MLQLLLTEMVLCRMQVEGGEDQGPDDQEATAGDDGDYVDEGGEGEGYEGEQQEEETREVDDQGDGEGYEGEQQEEETREVDRD
jgi:hypothetical protein